jgi:hypothetical protein
MIRMFDKEFYDTAEIFFAVILVQSSYMNMTTVTDVASSLLGL